MTAESIKERSFLNLLFLKALIANFFFVTISETWRYFVFVMPMMRETFSSVNNVAPMDVVVFLSWGVWMSLLILAATCIIWLWLDRFGDTLLNAVAAGTLVWAMVFVLLWFGLYNMNLATPTIMLTALPLAWAEMAVAGGIVWWMRRKLIST